METKEMILKLRKSLDLSQDEFAGRLFVTRQAVSRWENGDTIPNTETLKLIAETFQVSVDYLLGHPARLCQSCGMIEGTYHPSSDTATHLELYKAFPEIGGIVHTHSPWATSWAQAGRAIPCYGTTHADYMYGEIPCLRCLTKEEIDGAYEKNTGLLITDYFKDKDYTAVPACLCKNHGPFAWGKDAMEAVHNAVVLEEVAKMAARSEQINPQIQPAPKVLQDKHYLRKHGDNAYYGQN